MFFLTNLKTSSAGSATLEGTSIARCIIQLGSSIIGGTLHRTSIMGGGGDTAHTLLMGGTISVGTPHILCCGEDNWGGDTAQH